MERALSHAGSLDLVKGVDEVRVAVAPDLAFVADAPRTHHGVGHLLDECVGQVELGADGLRRRDCA
jgi:hypothetical protein